MMPPIEARLRHLPAGTTITATNRGRRAGTWRSDTIGRWVRLNETTGNPEAAAPIGTRLLAMTITDYTIRRGRP